MDQNIIEDVEVDLSFGYGDKLITTKGRIDTITSEGMVIDLDIDDKTMTLPPGTDIFILKGGGLYNIVDSAHFPRISVEKVKKRNHARVDDILEISYRKIPSEEYLQRGGNPRAILEDTFGEPLDIPDIEEVSTTVLYKLIYQLSLKVDRILDMLERKDERAYETIFGEWINISASGMRFKTGKDVQIGDIVALRISLPLAAATRLHVLSEVVSVSPPNRDGGRFISLKFIDLSPEVQETITRYVFKRQRNILRREPEERRQNNVF